MIGWLMIRPCYQGLIQKTVMNCDKKTEGLAMCCQDHDLFEDRLIRNDEWMNEAGRGFSYAH